MAYQPIEKTIPEYFNGEKVWGKRDCKDFKLFFFNRRYCKLSNKCKKCGYHCVEFEYYEPLESYYPETVCTGINKDRWQKIIS